MNKLIFLAAIIPVLLVPNVYASGPRHDYPDPPPTPYSTDCYRDGYEAGFAGKYDNDRAKECMKVGNDWYNKVWDSSCTKTGRSESEYNDIMNDPQDLGDHEQLDQENLDSCYDDGYEDGQNNPFDQERNEGCDDYQRMYYKGFIAVCESVGNTQDICERFTDQ